MEKTKLENSIVGTDVSSVLSAKKKSKLFSKDFDNKDQNVISFFLKFLGWLLTKPLNLVSKFLQLIISIEKMLLVLRVDMLQLFYWGRGNSFAVFLQAIIVFVIGIVGFTFVVGNVGSRVANQYGVDSISPVYASTENDILVESGSLTTLLPKEIKRLDVVEYIVTYRDVQQDNPLKYIAEKWDITADSIRWANNLKKSYQPKVGKKLKIPPISGSYYIVIAGEDLETIASRNKLDEVTLAEVNFLSEPYNIKAGQKLLLPGIAPQKPKPTTASGGVSSFNLYGGGGGTVKPVSGPTFLSWPVLGSGQVSRCYYGYAHNGIDVNPVGTGSSNPYIVAAAPGRVTYAGVHCTSGMYYKSVCGGYAWVVEIAHPNGFSTIYAHLKANSIIVRVGDAVDRGQKLAKMGATGTVYGNPGTHLHFQLNSSGFLGKSSLRSANPAPYIYANQRHGCN